MFVWNQIRLPLHVICVFMKSLLFLSSVSVSEAPDSQEQAKGRGACDLLFGLVSKSPTSGPSSGVVINVCPVTQGVLWSDALSHPG